MTGEWEPNVPLPPVFDEINPQTPASRAQCETGQGSFYPMQRGLGPGEAIHLSPLRWHRPGG